MDLLFTRKTNNLLNGLTGTQYLILIYLYEVPNQRTLQKNIENKFELSHPTTVGIVKRLAAQNLVVTRPFAKNRRQTEVIISDNAKNLLSNVQSGPREVLEEVDNTALTGFSNQERAQLSAYLQRINANLNG